MMHFALTVNLKNDTETIEMYTAYHAKPFPEVVEALKAVGILDMKIWLLGSQLFMYYNSIDGFNPDVDFKRYLSLNPQCQVWEDIMGNMQEAVPLAKPGEKWTAMQQVFQL